MVDNTTSTAAETADQSQQNCHLMKLPTELRLSTYEFAFGDVVDDIVADAANKKRMCEEANLQWPSPDSVSRADLPIFIGVLSFLHTSRELRRECLDALRAPIRTFRKICSDRYKVAAEACRIPIRDQYGNLRHYKGFLCKYAQRRIHPRSPDSDPS